MRFRQVLLQLQGNLRFGACTLLPTVERFIKMVGCRAGGSEPGVGEGKLRINANCLRIKLLGFLKILEQRIGVAFDLVGAQIKDVGIRVLGGFFLDARPFLWI